MRIIFDHNFGHQERGEFFHFGCELVDVAESEHNAALQQGFLETVHQGRRRWYQSRSTRVATAGTNYELLPTAHIMQAPIPWAEMDHIYTAYCYYKKFKKYFEVGEALPNDQFMAYYQYGNFVAWTKLRHYSHEAVETCLFVWDYAHPETQLGIRSLEHEIAWAKDAGYQHVYLGPGYERSSLYKSRLLGFEWWTGGEWSSDVNRYQWLCKRDSKLLAVDDLYNLQR